MLQAAHNYTTEWSNHFLASRIFGLPLLRAQRSPEKIDRPKVAENRLKQKFGMATG